jgi:hypothetical protein
MCCRILLALLDCIKNKQDTTLAPQLTPPITDNTNSPRELILKVLEIIVTKFKQISKTQVKYLLENNNVDQQQTQQATTLDENASSNEDKCKDIFIIDDDFGDLSKTDDVMQTQAKSQKKRDKLDAFLNSFDDKDNLKVIVSLLAELEFLTVS